MRCALRALCVELVFQILHPKPLLLLQLMQMVSGRARSHSAGKRGLGKGRRMVSEGHANHLRSVCVLRGLMVGRKKYVLRIRGMSAVCVRRGGAGVT
jgi:hypothetical protein